jgi:hypothetical protein
VTIAFFIINFINVFLFEVDCSKSARNQQSPRETSSRKRPRFG